MSLSRVKVWGNEILFPNDLNTEFNNILNYLNSLSSSTYGGTFKATNTGLQALDIDATNYLTLKPASNLTADRVLSILTGDVDKSLNLTQQTCAFSAYPSAGASNATGDGTLFTIVCNTEDYDIGNNFAAGVFTATVAGLHFFHLRAYIAFLTAAHNVSNIYLVRSDGQTFSDTMGNIGVLRETTSGDVQASMNIFAAIPLTVGQTVTPKVLINGGTKTITIGNGATARETNFSGFLIPSGLAVWS